MDLGAEVGWGLSQDYWLIARCVLYELVQHYLHIICIEGFVHTVAHLLSPSNAVHPGISDDLTIEHL